MFTEGVTAPRGPASQVAHSDDWWVGAGCWETSVPCPKDLSIMLLDCPRGTAAASSKASGLSMPRWGLQQLEWRKAHLTVSAMFYWSQKPGLSNTGGELQGPYTRSCKWWGGALWRLVADLLHQNHPGCKQPGPHLHFKQASQMIASFTSKFENNSVLY